MIAISTDNEVLHARLVVDRHFLGLITNIGDDQAAVLGDGEGKITVVIGGGSNG